MTGQLLTLSIGKTSKDSIKAKEALEAEFEDVFKDRTKEEKDEIQKRYGTMQAYLENMDRLKKLRRFSQSLRR